MSKKKPSAPRLSDAAIADIHRAYSTSSLSLRAIAVQHGCSEATIRAHAKRWGWTRDNASLIRAEGKAINSAAQAQRRVPQVKLDEQAVVRAGAELQAAIRLAHQDRLDRLGAMADKLLAEMDQMNMAGEAIEEIIGALIKKDSEGANVKTIEQVAAALSVDVRDINLKRLTEIVEKLHNAQRTAYDLDDPDTAGATLEGFLQGLRKEAATYAPPAITPEQAALTRASEEA